VKLQIRVAAGERLPFAQADVTARGHAIECRVYAEDPANGFLPATGTVLKASFPSAPGVRVDAGLESGDEVSIHYDPMIAKISVLGQHRAEAIHKLNWALAHTTILGVTTNLRFLRDVLAHPAFARGEVTTDFVEREFADWQPPSAPADLAMIASALNDVSGAGGNAPNTATPLHEAQPDPWQTDDNFRLGGT
jgi:acetyl/propionyl-CoA carboxylase alpha subunit